MAMDGVVPSHWDELPARAERRTLWSAIWGWPGMHHHDIISQEFTFISYLHLLKSTWKLNNHEINTVDFSSNQLSFSDVFLYEVFSSPCVRRHAWMAKVLHVIKICLFRDQFQMIAPQRREEFVIWQLLQLSSTSRPGLLPQSKLNHLWTTSDS